MNQATRLQTTVADSFQDLWVQLIQFLPELVGAVLLLAVGFFVGIVAGRLVARIVRTLNVDTALHNAGLDTVVARTGYRLNAATFLGSLVKWFVVAVFVLAAVNVLGLTAVNQFLNDVVLRFIPNVFVAVLILLFAAVIADFVKGLVSGAARAAEPERANFLGFVASSAIWSFALLAAMHQLGVAQVFIQTLFTGIMAALALAAGLAFGLGGKDAAGRTIAHLETYLRANK